MLLELADLNKRNLTYNTLLDSSPAGLSHMGDMPRVDVYIRPHKAIRSALYNTAIEIGTLDESLSLSASQKILNNAKAAIKMLLEHGSHEEAFIHPLYRERIPSSALDLLERDHVVHEQKLNLLGASIDELEREISDKGLACLYKNLNNFIASYLEHLELEESQLPLLWKHYSDVELMHLLQCFRASEGDTNALKGLTSLWSTLPETERHRLGLGMKQNASKETFFTIKQCLNLSI